MPAPGANTSRALLALLLVAALVGVTPGCGGERAAQTGALSIRSTPDGMAVQLDGDPIGTTPLDVVDVRAGKHRLRIVGPFHLPDERVIDVVGGTTFSLAVTLEAATGQLVIRTEPVGARVSLNGVPVPGVTPLNLERWPAGRYTVLIERAGYAPRTGEVVLRAGGARKVEARLDRR